MHRSYYDLSDEEYGALETDVAKFAAATNELDIFLKAPENESDEDNSTYGEWEIKGPFPVRGELKKVIEKLKQHKQVVCGDSIDIRKLHEDYEIAADDLRGKISEFET